MTLTISESLFRAATSASSWSDGRVRSVLAELVSADPSRAADWDEEAGEAWARVLDDRGVVAFVSGQLPLLIVRSGTSGSPDLGSDVLEVIEVRAVDDRDLRADRTAIEAAFPELASSLAEDPSLLDPEAFSAEELWYATV